MKVSRICFLLGSFFCGAFLHGQTLTVALDPIDQVLVGGSFTVSGSVSHDPNTPPIPGGTPVSVAIEVRDPSNNAILISPIIQDFGGMNGRTLNFSQTFAMPWSEDDKWTAANRWQARAEASSPVSALTFATTNFPILIADLGLDVNAPVTARPGDFVNLTGTIRNLAGVQTEPGVFFKIEASVPGSSFSHSIIFPPSSFEAGDPWPIAANSANTFTIPNVYIPLSTGAGPININVSVDQPSITNGVSNDIIPEQENQANNTLNHTVNVDVGQANLQSANFLINGGLEGAFQGLDAVRCSVLIRNIGTGQVAAGDDFDYRVLLSNDLTASTDDFLLRQVDLGPNGLGGDLFPNETITLDWVQTLPDNFEGDFYIVSEINGVPSLANQTPSLSLRSENVTTIASESAQGGPGHHHSRPSTTLDGMMIAHESLNNGLNQIVLVNKSAGTSTTITIPTGGGLPNGSSYAPVISSNGKFVVFHSHASNLVPNDTNGHVDVFRYEVFNDRLTRLSLGTNGEEGNGGSFYPVVSEDGSKVAFESHATNLDPSVSTSGKQIFLWTESNDSSLVTGTIAAITNGNGDSFDASTSDDGKRLVFTTYATNLVVGEPDVNGHSDAVFHENGTFLFAGRTEDGILPTNGETREPEISKDGNVITFVSSARNMVTRKGIAFILIEEAGVGYTTDAQVLINDVNGTGAVVRVSNINPYGEILSFAVDNPGRNYVEPTLSVVAPATSPVPDKNATAIPLLVNPEGDVFRITVDFVKAGKGSERISESPALDGDPGSETGGNQGSREPTISKDGSHIAYSTRSSNLLDLNVTSTNLKTFANHGFRPARTQAVLHWGIGSIVITNPGSNYLGTGDIVIEDLSGSGSGAVATYSALGNGQIGSVTIVHPGTGYDLNQTIVTIQNDPTGSGFLYRILETDGLGFGVNRTGGATIHRIEVIDPGIGYPAQLNASLEKPSIIIDGDGADLDGNNVSDARLNPDRLFIGSDGQIFIEQQIDFNIKNHLSLIGTTLTISDVNRTLELSFASTPLGPNVLGIDKNSAGQDQNATMLRDDLTNTIKTFWGRPTNLSEGIMVENNMSGGTSFTLRGLNASAESTNPSALQITYRSNMLVQGNGYTRATPFVSPAPVVVGFSEVQTGTTTIAAPNGRPIFETREDRLTDDIYFYDHLTSRNRRASLSKFGLPTNYLSPLATHPSHRFPSLSGDGRFLIFSSDAAGTGGLIFGQSNQIPQDMVVDRSIYSVDLKSRELPKNNDYTISISSNLLSVTGSKLYLSRPFPVMVESSSSKGFLNTVRLYVDGVQVGNNAVAVPGTRNHKTFFSWTPTRQGTHEIIASVLNNIGEEIFSSPVTAEVIAPTSTTAMGNLSIRPNGTLNQITQGSSLLGSVEFTGSNGKKATLASVSFYLNDQLISTQYDPPFSTVFSPPAYDGKNSLTRWSLTALGQDLNGSTVVTSRFGRIQGSLVLPSLNLKPINTLSGMSDNEVFDKQRVTVEASVQGDSDSLALVQSVRFYANGFLLDGNVTGVPITTSSGQIKSIEYKIDWDVDFAKFAKPDGTVEIVAFGELGPVGGFTPVFPSALLLVRVSPPTPWLNEKSTALSIFSDLSDSNMSTRQVEALLEKINSGDDGVLESWANDLSEVASFQQKLSVIAARHICMGEWHDSFLDLETDFNNWIPTGAVNTSWLKNYIDSVLYSDQYIAKYGIVPLLVGFENEKDIHDFDLNRRSFAERCLTNKYGATPSFQQMFQGSKRMVHYWNNLSGGNYWEVSVGGAPAVGAPVFFSPPRVDSFTTNAYQAGECAVEFVMKLTEEIPIDNLSYILYTEPLRKNTYKVATFIQLLWRENADPVQDSDIKRLSDMPINDAIKSILNDYRYTSRFNLIWKDSTVIDANTPSWKNEEWFGYFWDKHFPWVYHTKYEWIYIAGVSPTQFWFHYADLGWLWTGAAYYKGGYAYSNKLQQWIYLSPENKTYYSQVSKSWVSY